MGVGSALTGMAKGCVVAGRVGDGARPKMGTGARGPIGDLGPLRRGDVGQSVRIGDGDLLRIRRGADADMGVGDPERTAWSARFKSV